MGNFWGQTSFAPNEAVLYPKNPTISELHASYCRDFPEHKPSYDEYENIFRKNRGELEQRFNVHMHQVIEHCSDPNELPLPPRPLSAAEMFYQAQGQTGHAISWDDPYFDPQVKRNYMNRHETAVKEYNEKVAEIQKTQELIDYLRNRFQEPPKPTPFYAFIDFKKKSLNTLDYVKTAEDLVQEWVEISDEAREHFETLAKENISQYQTNLVSYRASQKRRQYFTERFPIIKAYKPDLDTEKINEMITEEWKQKELRNDF